MNRSVYKRWKLLLPGVHFALAITLFVAGKMQTERDLKGAFAVWDYRSPAETILHSINYPVLIATGFTVQDHTFRKIGIEYSTKSFIVYLLYLLALWYGFGWCVDNRRRSPPSKYISVSLALLGLLSGGVLLLSAFGALQVADAPLLVGSGFLWGMLFLCFFVTLLARTLRRAG